MIKELPLTSRPRERFKTYGAEALSDDELISILLRTGTKSKSVKEVSLNILKEISLEELKDTNYHTLKDIKGVGEVKAITLLAAIELGKRILNAKSDFVKVRNSSDVYQIASYEMSNKLQEQFMAIYLDTLNHVIMKKVLFIGTVNKSEITPRDIFREAVKNNASNVILVHNHPAGSVTPSSSDLYLTQEIVKLGEMLGIKVLDHIIIGNNNYYSIKERHGDLFET